MTEENADQSLKTLKQELKALKNKLAFGTARKLLESQPEEMLAHVRVRQQLALCTYKDQDLLPATRFRKALEILDELGLREKGKRQRLAFSPDEFAELDDADDGFSETLGLGGGLYKRQWEYGGRLEDLYESLAYYKAAHVHNPYADAGYGAINAAFILDLLAARLKKRAEISGTEAEEVAGFEKDAAGLRQEVVEQLPQIAAHKKRKDKTDDLESRYRYQVTLAEAHYGLRRFSEAAACAAKAREIGALEWELEATFKQLVSMARLMGNLPPDEDAAPENWQPCWQPLYALLGEEAGPALSCYRGKFGLALSGGGFRASFFHLGVMAGLADMDVLRSVEVLSAVSGGSILGAHYYLEEQRRLENTLDANLKCEDYIAIVKTVQEQFLEGVQRNLRVRVFSNLGANLKMLFFKGYSHSNRLGELYESELFKKVLDGRGAADRLMRDLLVRPRIKDPKTGELTNDEAFNPTYSNWRRRAKVPILLLNATTLNSGHNWQFTAKWMGEPPGLLGSEIDKNMRLRRVYYDDIPVEDLRDYRLGYAVAASSCVPGVFEPLLIDGLYPGKQVRLVDGGVHDNQGIQGLLDQACTVCLVSDASGQMDDLDNPSNTVIGVPLRSFSISMDRVREAQAQDLQGRLDGGALNGLFFVHTKMDLEVEHVDSVGHANTNAGPAAGTETSYGVDKEIQAQLAGIRTDLDSFTEVEASALMLSGYLMTRWQFRELRGQQGQSGTWSVFDIGAPESDWSFLNPALRQAAYDSPASTSGRRANLGRQLAISSKLFGKVFHMYPALKWAGMIIVAAALLYLGYLFATSDLWETVKSQARKIAAGLLLLLILLVFPALKYLMPKKASREYVLKFLLGTVGFLVAHLHLAVFDRLYKKAGEMEKL